MSRLKRRDRRDRRELLDETTALGEDMLRIRESGAYRDEGFASFEAFAAHEFLPRCVARWHGQLNNEQAAELLVVAMDLATKRRSKTRRP